GGSGAGGAAPARCAPALDAGFASAAWSHVTSPGAAVSIDAAGRLVIQVDGGGDAALVEAGLVSQAGVHFADCAIQVELVQAIDGVEAATVFGLTATTGAKVDEFAIENGAIDALVSSGSGTKQATPLGPAPSAARHLRLRAAAKQTFFGVSTDGAAWTEHALPTPDFGATDPVVTLAVVANPSDAALPGQAVFRNDP
ncbi:MAG TPA: hypothetical protein VHB21_01110, partial [Minicystis sp.]|nr:hypothetical protein [Minicystis sp.]